MRYPLIVTVALGALGCETRPLDPDEWVAYEEGGPAFDGRWRRCWRTDGLRRPPAP